MKYLLFDFFRHTLIVILILQLDKEENSAFTLSNQSLAGDATDPDLMLYRVVPLGLLAAGIVLSAAIGISVRIIRYVWPCFLL